TEINSLTKDKDKEITNLEQEKTNLQTKINSLNESLIQKEQEKSDLKKITDKLIEDKDKEITKLEKKITIFSDMPVISDEPYLEYKDQNGNIIREYKFFEDMFPKEKDKEGRINFFHKKDFVERLRKIKLNHYPIIWTEGIDNFGVTRKNQQNKDVFISDYRFIYTSLPKGNVDQLIKMDFKLSNAENGIINDSISFSKTKNKSIDLMSSEDIEKSVFEHRRVFCIRLMTKNLKFEFDWLRFICYNFKDKLPKTSEALELLLLKNSEKIEKVNNLLNQNTEYPKFTFQIHNIDDSEKIYFTIDYDKKKFIDFLKKIDLKKQDRLYDIREFIIYNNEKKFYDPFNKYHIEIPTKINNTQYLL
uniref:coiled-coil domain-containing protein n=1 Tax=Candidatus Phytoplasma prunorum TaxID=47565 RepID=UPI002FF1C568